MDEQENLGVYSLRQNLMEIIVCILNKQKNHKRSSKFLNFNVGSEGISTPIDRGMKVVKLLALLRNHDKPTDRRT